MPTENRSSTIEQHDHIEGIIDMVSVPRVLTREMLNGVCMHPDLARSLWSALLKNAPKPTEQHQGEPVAWGGINELGEVVTDWIDGVPPSSMVDSRGSQASFAKIEQAYTHADPDEVERLNDALEELRKAYTELEAQVDSNFKVIDDLRAQQAEQDALLKRMQSFLCLPHITQFDSSDDLLIDVCAALSASAEPSAPVEADEPVCKGAWQLGTACGKCRRCRENASV